MNPSRRLDTRSDSHILRVALLTLITCAGGCTFTPGDPHGEVSVSYIDVMFDIEDRLEPGTQERLRVGNDYVLELESFDLTLGEIVVEASAEAGAENTGFDPSSPPPGFSLCHNGHCHADDGRLVPYEEIARELAQGSGAAGTERLLQEVNRIVSLTPTRRTSSLEDVDEAACTNSCQLTSPGTPSAAFLIISAIEIKATVFDTSDRARLPEEGLVLHATVTPAAPFELFGSLSPPNLDTSAPRHELGGSLTILPTIFDGIDWSITSTDPDVLTTALLDVERYAWTPTLLSTKD